MADPNSIRPAILEWRNGAPYAPAFEDVYFFVEDGIAETHYVFLDGNDLPRRFASADRFVIGETGFGTGLNFLSTYRLWRKTALPGARLTYCSVEKHPLSPGDLRRAHAAWPELAEEAAWLQAAYPAAMPGFHLRRLPGGVDLLLGFGEAAALLAGMEAHCDAWFLDGFAPAKNGAMWEEKILRLIAARTEPGGTLATFTAAGDVRRGLEAAGFAVERVPGFGRKRHMTRACVPGQGTLPAPRTQALVIGGGLAGAAAARALAERGVRVTLLEAKEMASGASGTPAALLSPLIHRQWSPATRFYLAAYQHVLSRLAAAPSSLREGLTGLLQLPKRQHGVRDAEGFAALPARLGLPPEIARAVTPDEASRLNGRDVHWPGVFFPDGGSIVPRDVIAWLLDHPGIEWRTGMAVTALRREGDRWIAEAQEVFSAETVILATALPGLAASDAPVAPVSGQISLPPGEISGIATGYGGYLCPQRGQLLLGATYSAARLAPQEAHAENLVKLRDALPDAASALGDPDDAWGEWHGVRAVSRDRLPLVGRVAEGCYTSLAHGSRGAVSAMLSGEIVAAMACGDPLPVEAEIVALLDPMRFARRQEGPRRAS